MDLFGIVSKIVIETTPLQDGFNRGTYKGVLSCTIFTQKDIYYRLVLTRLQHNTDYVAVAANGGFFHIISRIRSMR